MPYPIQLSIADVQTGGTHLLNRLSPLWQQAVLKTAEQGEYQENPSNAFSYSGLN